ncbi:MAG: hypothetical protein ACRCXZ_03975, partial [Patescibacteria group bacterium]
NQKMQLEVEQKIKQYNQSVNEINSCLRSLNLSEHQLPVINQQKAVVKIESKTESFNDHNNESYS